MNLSPTDGGITGHHRRTGWPVSYHIRPATGDCTMPPAPTGIPKDCFVLAEHYGFTDKELDLIVNYDIKYRMRLAGQWIIF